MGTVSGRRAARADIGGNIMAFHDIRAKTLDGQVVSMENGGGEEIVNLLKHVRPGNGFQFKGDMFDKVEVNGENEHPLFTFLKKSLPAPSDDSESLMASPHFLIWKPVRRTDIAWNFEKFLIGKDGTPIKRYSRNFLTKDTEADIKNCL